MREGAGLPLRKRRRTSDHVAILRAINVPGPGGTSMALGTKPINTITKADVEAVREARRRLARRREGKLPSRWAKGGEVGINRLVA